MSDILRLEELQGAVEQMINTGDFNALDTFCSDIDVQNQSLYDLVNFLRTTRPAKQQLPSRVHLCDQIEAQVRKSRHWRPDFMESLR